jgi:hypothetical protein
MVPAHRADVLLNKILWIAKVRIPGAYHGWLIPGKDRAQKIILPEALAKKISKKE